MNISAINSTSPAFSSKYQLNINQTMPDGRPSIDRDLMLGIWLNQAKNEEDITTKINEFFKNEYNNNQIASCNVIYDIPNSEDAHFEKCMNKVGQKFSKIA